MPNSRKLFALAMVAAAVCLLGQATFVQAQTQRELDIKAAKAERKAIIGQNMQLTPAEAKVFWPIYSKYEAAMDRVDEMHAQEIRDYAKSYRNMTNEAAKAKLDQTIAVQEARLQVQKQFIPQFRAVLSQIKTTRFFQIDNKLHSMVQCQIAQLVPLVGTPPPSSMDRGQ
jgi:hypothetical protein